MRAGARHAGRLKAALALVVGFLVVQVIVGLAAHSLAVLSDAGHMATDAIGLGMAWAAIAAADRGARTRYRTFGLYRLEILAALANAVLLFGVSAYVLVEAIRRLGDPAEIASTSVLVVGIVGLAVNVVCFALLRGGAEESINVRGAYLEVVADMLGSVGVIIAAVVTKVTDWGWIDPAIGAAIGLFILPRAWKLGGQALRVLVQAAPEGVDVAAVQSDLAAIDDVVDVHDLHVWTLTSEMDVASAHVMVRVGSDTHRVLDTARTVLRERHGLDHATLQIEPDDHRGCDEMSW